MPVDLIIDTDMSIDVDDVGMLCAAHALMDFGEARILAVMHDAHLDTGAGAISAINNYYGRSDLPIGVYRGDIGKPTWYDMPDWTREGRGVYVDDLVARFAPPQPTWEGLPNAASLYRSTLTAAADSSVTVVAVGFGTNIVDLLSSDPDEVSPLDGRALVARKVARLIVMGGTDPSDPDWAEWNFGGGCDEEGCSYGALGEVTKRQFDLWPKSVPKTFISFQAGVDVKTGWSIRTRNLTESPCDRAYVQFCQSLDGWCDSNPRGGGGRCSWDPMALLYGVRGDPHGYYTAVGGSMTVYKDGQNTWEDGDNSETNEWMLRINETAIPSLALELDRLYWYRPRPAHRFAVPPPTRPPPQESPSPQPLTPPTLPPSPTLPPPIPSPASPSVARSPSPLGPSRLPSASPLAPPLYPPPTLAFEHTRLSDSLQGASSTIGGLIFVGVGIFAWAFRRYSGYSSGNTNTRLTDEREGDAESQHEQQSENSANLQGHGLRAVKHSAKRSRTASEEERAKLADAEEESMSPQFRI